ncbi:hypothetical protein [Niabella beijingensis]|uniref:hypothetical protein n=1 Tax=Niabella beijingensis TaxID=2872700 RepID=UPI001CBE5C12|nr:hypothetical protein [Niabella beijingensis]MBZ4191747.1 hypothetical protein [Niabella beijingensis]
MKSLFLFLILGSVSNTALAQNTAPTLITPTLYLYSYPNSDVVDTSSIKKLNDKFYIARARQDNMPVLLPSGAGGAIPNATRPQTPRDRMPNLWKKPTQDLKSSPRTEDRHDLQKLPRLSPPPKYNSKNVQQSARTFRALR